MSNSAPNHDRPVRSEETPHRTAPANGPREGVSAERDLLDRVIAETRLAESDQVSLEFEALKVIARRYPAAPFALDPVAIELVESMLRCHFRDWPLPPLLTRQMAQHVAESLLDEPTYREQVAQLWQRVMELSQV